MVEPIGEREDIAWDGFHLHVKLHTMAGDYTRCELPETADWLNQASGLLRKWKGDLTARDVEIERLRAALQFYRDKWHEDDTGWHPSLALLIDAGSLANAALAGAAP